MKTEYVNNEKNINKWEHMEGLNKHLDSQAEEGLQ